VQQESRAGVVQTIDSTVSTTVVRPDGYHATVNFGTVIIGSPNLTTNRFTLKDNGANPQNNLNFTTSVTGNATVSPLGGPTVLLANGTAPLTVGVNTSAVGLRSGVVTVDSSPPGNDHNEVYTVNATVLDHSNGSFASNADLNALTFNFGSFAPGSGTSSAQKGISNLVTTALFTAGLDLVSITPTSGDTGILTTNLSSFSNLAAGGTHNFDVFFNHNTAGVYSAVYTLHLSDQQTLAGATTQDVTLTLTGTVVPEPPSVVYGAIASLVGFGFLRRHRRRTALSSC